MKYLSNSEMMNMPICCIWHNQKEGNSFQEGENHLSEKEKKVQAKSRIFPVDPAAYVLIVLSLKFLIIFNKLCGAC